MNEFMVIISIEELKGSMVSSIAWQPISPLSETLLFVPPALPTVAFQRKGMTKSSGTILNSEASPKGEVQGGTS